jgi:AcrR family transcriptional regulator
MARIVKGSRRAYRSPVRTEQAENTRTRAIDAALRLFVERGYAGTTVAAVADEAGISPETIYVSLKGKRGLLEGVIETAIMGPEGVVVERQRWLEEVAHLPTARERLQGWVEASCRTLARTSAIHAVIRGAADREEFAVSLRERLLRQRVASVTALAQRFLGGSLKPGLTVEDAGQRYAAMASPELYNLLTAEIGWTDGRYRQWLTQLLEADLLATSPGERS